jgi:crotonobetainyl-CoA:carnitine CoA-transferase CaiB-like acyl-CoA transferase
MSTESMPPAEGPLSGYLVVDLSRALAGPHAGMMLADLGARVIKVENPGTGDDPQATYFLSCNRNKESIALDLKSDDGRTVLRELLERADVVIENFRPGVLDRLGFSAAEMHALNPALVVLSITGFGHDGPESRRSGYDQILQGEAGLMSLTGSGPDDPQRVGVPIADLLSGMYGAFGALAALLQRERTGQGQIVRTSLLAALIGVHAFQGTRSGPPSPRRSGSTTPGLSSPPTRTGCGTGKRSSKRWNGHSPTSKPNRC